MANEPLEKVPKNKMVKKKKVKSKKKSIKKKANKKKEMTSKRKTLMAIVAVVVILAVLFLCLFLFTGVFEYNSANIAEKKLAQIEIPEIPYAEFIKDGSSSGPPSPPAVPNMDKYDFD